MSGDNVAGGIACNGIAQTVVGSVSVVGARAVKLSVESRAMATWRPAPASDSGLGLAAMQGSSPRPSDQPWARALSLHSAGSPGAHAP